MTHKCPHCGEDTGHVWSKWYPKSRSVVYRTCLDPNCRETEEKEVKA